ncbi:hypothetical protein [Segetibacter koreensis]|uniref:hypothetical protein n=1 Tax=Segetibacter koreensis TaxID=398037 RepID=UPI0003A953A0|nr:hypothetical protein [Segetibacter koreensis]
MEQYNKVVKSELESGKRMDTIFFNIHFGMTGKEFFAYCWEMNKKGLFTDGQSNTAVLYRLNHNELKYPASLNFYPEMYENRINKMSAVFQYDAWAPWNKQLFSDKLLADVLNLYKKWYNKGNPFIEIKVPGKSTVYVKVDANRRITMAVKDDMTVQVNYTDLLTEKKFKK